MASSHQSQNVHLGDTGLTHSPVPEVPVKSMPFVEFYLWLTLQSAFDLLRKNDDSTLFIKVSMFGSLYCC